MSDNNKDGKPFGGHNDFMLAQYTALRDEILKRIGIKYQVLALTPLVAGTFLSLGVQSSIPVSVLMVYPILAMFLAERYAQNDRRIYQVSLFIRTEIERVLGSMGWETYRDLKGHKRDWGPLGLLDLFATGGLFLCTQLLAVGLSLARWPRLMADGWVAYLLLGLDVLAIVGTFLLLRPAERLERSHHQMEVDGPSITPISGTSDLPPAA